MKTSPQQDRLLVALTRDYPRTVDNLVAETGMPRASVRRVLSELGRIPSPRVRPLVIRALVDRLEGN